MPQHQSNKYHRCDVAMLVDEETGERSVSGKFVPDRSSMEEKVLAALRARYPHVTVVPFGPDIPGTMAELAKLKPRMVFNLTEWVNSDRRLDHAIVGLLEMMKFRFTGTAQIGMQLSRDKWLSKHIVASAGVDVPQSMVLERRDRIKERGVRLPLIVKPQFGDGSDGIGKTSLVRTLKQLRERVAYMKSQFNEPLICEEFVPGRDIYVGIIGNEPRVLKPTEMVIESAKPSAPQFATYRVKNDGRYRTKWRVRYGLADLPRATLRTLNDYSITIFRMLKLRDYARLDFRLTDQGRLVFIEANPNPDLTPHTLGNNLCFVGIQYERLIPLIVETALKRYRART